MNMALDGETPYDNIDTYKYLQRHMSIVKSGQLPWLSYFKAWDGSKYSSGGNFAFYTTDGMRFEVDDNRTSEQMSGKLLKLHESDVQACFITMGTKTNSKDDERVFTPCGGCGSFGLKHNPNNTTKPPCAILVDVNGDRKPTPSKVLFDSYKEAEGNGLERYWIPDLESKRVSDIFVVLITEDRAIPYGVVAQKAMYQAQK